MRRDIVIGLGLLAVCGVMYRQAGFAPTPPFVPFGPAFYPRVILVILGALALWLIVEAAVEGGGATRTPAAQRTALVIPHRVLVGFTLFLVYVVLLSVIGFLAATFLFVLGMSWAMGPRSARELPKLAALALGTTVATYLVFERYLHVFLPRGFAF